MAAPAPVSAPETPTRLTSVRRLRPALGTWLALEASAATAPLALAALEAACTAVAEVESLMHPDRPDSDVQRINTAPPGVDVAVHPLTFEVLSFARRLHLLSQGVFDPCLPAAPARFTDLTLRRTAVDPRGPSAATCQVRSARRPALDLGGIAKGFAGDRAVLALERAGCAGGLVNVGGDLRVFGPQPAPIVLRQPRAPEQLLWLSNAALAVSDPRAAARPGQHRGYYRRGAKAARVRYTAVLAADAMSADALTKCVMLCTPRAAQRALRACGATALRGGD